MKNTAKTLFLILLSFIYFNTSAQDFQFGFKGGLNFANLGGDSQNTSMKFGGTIGIYSVFKATDFLEIQPELMYATQGADAKLDGERIASANYNYVNLPIMMKLYPTKHKFNLQVGPQFGVLTSGKIVDAYDRNVFIDVRDEMTKIDFGIGLGMGLSTKDIDIDLRYTLGISSTVAETGEGNDVPNRVLQLTFGYKFKS